MRLRERRADVREDPRDAPRRLRPFTGHELLERHAVDELGSAYSDQPDDPTLWTVERFREEVEQVRAALGLEQFVLYGHSWGGLLAVEYALKYPQHLRGLVISNMTASIPLYEKHMAELRAQLAHFAMWDDQQAYMRALVDFLKSVQGT